MADEQPQPAIAASALAVGEDDSKTPFARTAMGGDDSATVKSDSAVSSAAPADVNDGAAAASAAGSSSGVGDGAATRSARELVARAIAPVKAAYLRPPPQRSAVGGSGAASQEKKSRRQLKRERKMKSALQICMEVARSGKVDSCMYGSSCRFSHDINAYLAVKPTDLEGICPFSNLGQRCPYGITCRFASMHKDNASPPETRHKMCNEINSLNKDFQRLLWKGKVCFPKADAQLKLLGLKIKSSSENTEELSVCHDEDESGVLNGDNQSKTVCISNEEEECVDNSIACNESRPAKKARGLDDDSKSDQVNNGTCFMELEAVGDGIKNGTEVSSPNQSLCRVDLIGKPHLREKKFIDFRDKLYLAPLTTVGNLPFRRICKKLGADITCGEMAMCSNLLQGQASEWALLRRHASEDIFGVQICGAYPDTVARAVEIVNSECSVDFIDINMGCPIDIVVNKGAGSSLLTKPMRMKGIIQAASNIIDKPLTVKVRTAFFEGRNRIDSLVSEIHAWGVSALTIHGRSRQQRYSKLADWDYIYQCARKAPADLHVIGNGDIFSYTDWNEHSSGCSQLSSCMIARGALVKPWVFTEIKEQRHWDISSTERFDILKDFVHFGLEHWGSDSKGVETTRHFLLEWLSYTYRYIPVGLLEIIPQRLNWRPPSFSGRDDLETLMASDSAADWIRISEMLLGKVPEGFTFAPKHKSNAYDRAENG